MGAATNWRRPQSRPKASDPGGSIDHMPKLDPDTATNIRLIGTAERLFHAKGNRDAAMAELQRIAGGRVDLLASAAGHFLGSDAWASHECYRLLWEAGAEAEPELVEAAAEQVRVNRGRAAYGSEGMGGPNLDRR